MNYKSEFDYRIAAALVAFGLVVGFAGLNAVQLAAICVVWVCAYAILYMKRFQPKDGREIK